MRDETYEAAEVQDGEKGLQDWRRQEIRHRGTRGSYVGQITQKKNCVASLTHLFSSVASQSMGRREAIG